MSQTVEDRAKNFVFFLDEYLVARDQAQHHGTAYYDQKAKSSRQFLGMALVALVTDAQRKVDE